MKHIKILIIPIFVAITFSCDRNELFKREQYKNMFAILSDDGYNIFPEEFDLKQFETDGFVVAGCGGSQETVEDILIGLEEDNSLLYSYNKSNYDTDESRYAKKLSAANYDIEKYQILIPAGERTGRMRIKVRANGLSPDSIYFIPLKVNTFSAYEIQPTKSTVLYRVLIKNYWATQKTATTYTLRGKRNDVNVMGTQQVFPVSGNKVRVMAGNEAFSANMSVIEDGAIVLEIGDDNRVKITSWKNLQVTQIDGDPDYPNIFVVEDTGYNTYKTFLLRYDYVFGGATYQMREELRLEFNPKKQ